MTNASWPLLRFFWPIESVVSRKPRERKLEHDLAGTLRPAATFLSLFQSFQLAANIDEHAGQLRANGFDCPRDALLGGNDLIAQVGGVRRSSPPRSPAGRKRRP